MTFRDQSGFTVAEVVAAIAILGIGLVALLTAMTAGVADVDAARRSTTALFLAEQRMEQVKAFALSPTVNKGFANVTVGNFPAEAYGSIASYTDSRRSVTITDSPGGAANTKQVEVFVFYRPATSSGLGAETSAVVSTLLVLR